MTAIDRLGKYQLLEQIRYGSLGRVYKAQDPLLNRVVALKVLVEAGVTEAVRARFFAETRASAKLIHPNILTLYDVGEDQGRLFVVMEYVEGEGIEAIIRRRAEVPLEAKLAMMRQICRGLGYAHRQGVVHADVKPGNVMVLPDGMVKLLDFGLARIAMTAQAAASLTAIAAVAASPYQAPECAHTRGDRRADIFSAAALLYELTASGPPAALGAPARGSGASASAASGAEPASLFAPDPAIPAELGPVLERALRRDPAERFQEMAEMEAALDGFPRDRQRLPQTEVSTDPPRRDAPKPAPVGGLTFPLLPTAVEAAAVEPDEDDRTLPAPRRATRGLAAVVARHPLTAVIAIAAVVLLGGGAAYWQVMSDAAVRDRDELDVALEQLVVARAAATQANAELPSAELFADAAGLDRTQRDLAEAQHWRDAAVSARAAAQAYLEAARRAGAAVRTAADNARGQMQTDKERVAPGTPEYDQGRLQEEQGDRHYAAGRFPAAAQAFRSAGHLFAQGARAPAAPPPAPAGADAQIRDVLRSYARAFETKDLELLQRVRLSMTPGEVARHRSVFAQTQSYRIGLRIDRIVVRGNEAEARGQREDTIVTNSGETIHTPGDFQFALRRVGERWRVERVR